jgi:hypothetical protein
MPDPAIEAAQRAWEQRYPNGSVSLAASAYRDGLGAFVVAGAREALQPIRELHRPFVTNDPRSPHDVVCNHCLGPKQWPCTTALYAYTTEELMGHE